MKAAEISDRMRELEHHPEREYTIAGFMQWLLGIDDADIDDVSLGMLREVQRARLLAVNHYQHVTDKVHVGSHDIDCNVAFMQGATFAAAALGHEPEGEPGHE